MRNLVDHTAIATHFGQHLNYQTTKLVLKTERAARAVRVTTFVPQTQRPPCVYPAALANTKQVLVTKPALSQ